MPFRLHPVLDKMEKIYLMPRNRERFAQYLFLLQGNNKDEMILPIAGYNPMGKEHVLEKLRSLKSLGAEEILENVITKVNSKYAIKITPTFEVVINLADDLGGAWTNKFTTDFASKFELNALVQRGFCTPYFWTSETYTEDQIAERISAYIYRTIFWIKHGKPKTLHDHLQQEIFVFSHLGNVEISLDEEDLKYLERFYTEHTLKDKYDLIFNFFYGDKASESLAFKAYGMPTNGGFELAKYLAFQQA